jgi:micrococcal nuclease
MQLTPLIKVVVTAVVVTALGWLGLSVERAEVADAIDQVFQSSVTSSDESNSAEAPLAQQTNPAQVVRVVDGDTVVVRLAAASQSAGQAVRVRLIGIDAPELTRGTEPAECLAEAASDRLSVLLGTGTVRLSTDSTQDQYDQYDRLLAYVDTPNGLDVGEVLIEEGLATEYTYDEPYQRLEAYETAEIRAKATGRGVWGQCGEQRR